LVVILISIVVPWILLAARGKAECDGLECSGLALSNFEKQAKAWLEMNWPDPNVAPGDSQDVSIKAYNVSLDPLGGFMLKEKKEILEFYLERTYEDFRGVVEIASIDDDRFFMVRDTLGDWMLLREVIL
jgi:hypothetical protein